MQLKRIEIAWLAFKEVVIPADAPDEQISDMKKAFYAGALSLFNTLVYNVDQASDEPTDKDMQMAQDIDDELEEFFAGIAVKH